MTQLIATNSVTAIVGLGLTGLSVARYLHNQGCAFVMVDSRHAPPMLAKFKQEFPTAAIELGPLNVETLTASVEMVVSPGVALSTTAIAAAIEAGVPAIGDIELFSRAAQAPIVAITGSNAKSTVTTLVGLMAEHAGVKVAVGGNIGIPALDLLAAADTELYVLELSSFQLETTQKLSAKVATILNISADHMDRYDGLPQYHAAKQRVYFGAEHVVINRGDVLTQPPLIDNCSRVSFAATTPDFKQFGVITQSDGDYLAWQFEPLLAVRELKIKGRHNIENALAALALGQAVKLPMASMLKALREFPGLPHRCQWLGKFDGVDYYNDSKGTNVGATLAALDGLAGSVNKLILIAGGVGKGADFSALTKPLLTSCRAMLVLGEDADSLAAIAPTGFPVLAVDSLLTALQQAQLLAHSDDAVLLSPACASFDMFTGFEARGDAFISALNQITGDAND